jgi:hypothetical protein
MVEPFFTGEVDGWALRGIIDRIDAPPPTQIGRGVGAVAEATGPGLRIRILAVIRRRRSAGRDGMDRLLSETQGLVSRLVRENRALRARNDRLDRELERVSAGWEQLRKLVKLAPRRRRGA